MTEATVSITDVFPEAVRIARQDLRVGDTVFDTFGGKHGVVKVQHYKAHTTARRADGEVFVLAGDETITVIKGEQA